MWNIYFTHVQTSTTLRGLHVAKVIIKQIVWFFLGCSCWRRKVIQVVASRLSVLVLVKCVVNYDRSKGSAIFIIQAVRVNFRIHMIL